LEPSKGPFRMPDRGFEFGLNTNAVVTNSFLSVGEIFTETIVLDLNELNSGFMAGIGFGVTSFFLNINSKKGWGFGISTSVEGIGVLGLPGNLLNFGSADNLMIDLSGALFATTDIHAYFNVQKFKVSVKPSLYYTLAYIKPEISYTFLSNENGNTFNLDYSVSLFTAFLMDDFPNNINLNGSPGFGITVGVEYPLAREIGLAKLLPFLDFDVGIRFENIPIVPSVLRNYMRMEGSVGSTEPFHITESFDDIFSLFDPDFGDMITGEEVQEFFRPFKMVIWANWRPLFGSNLLTVTPMLGFNLSQLYVSWFSAEFGINASVNLANIFIATAGINFIDRTWINSLDLSLNLRAFQLDLGVDMRSANFIKSWTAGGVGVYLGLTFGW